jgi:endonuclease YncB( thermonuclease family)
MMRWGVAILAWLMTTASFATEAVVRDAGTITLGNTIYRLNGIDAPAIDQICVDDHADPWSCGIDARDLLVKLIDKHDVSCADLGPDDASKTRRRGLCTAAGSPESLNQLLVRQGFALNLEPSAKGRFKADETAAQTARVGLWKGCFVPPQNFRKGLKTSPLFGAACRKDKDAELRDVLFPTEPAAPPGCTIKAQYARRAKLTFNVGVYHLRGCPSYPAVTKPHRWFCAEDDARAEGFRRAFNCRASAAKTEN